MLQTFLSRRGHRSHGPIVRDSLTPTSPMNYRTDADARETSLCVYSEAFKDRATSPALENFVFYVFWQQLHLVRYHSFLLRPLIKTNKLFKCHKMLVTQPAMNSRMNCITILYRTRYIRDNVHPYWIIIPLI